MLHYKAAGRLPERIEFSRNSRRISATRKDLGVLRVSGQTIRIADQEMIAEFPALPLRFNDGAYHVYAYDWQHARGSVHVCAVLQFRPQRWALTRRLRMDNRVRPDLADGLIVDFGAITIESENAISLQSGLGDGYYPIFVNRNFGLFLQSIVVDFKIWELPNIALMPGQRLDEFGMVVCD